MNPVEKMRRAGCPEVSIRSFTRSLAAFHDDVNGYLPESALTPVQSLERPDFPHSGPVAQTVVIKLNGGLGTSMGLQGPKSLLPIRGDRTFLDLILAQVRVHRERHPGLRFLLMNSHATESGTPSELPSFLQHQVPKITPTGEAVSHAPALDWCPPGHGDLYSALWGSGMLEELLANDVRYAFVSNSDNLGATLDPGVLGWFAKSGAPFLMEVTARTTADRKGGHLAQLDGQLVLREGAMCAPEDRESFQDIGLHRFFNTNNLWLRLDALHDLLSQHDGVLPLAVIQNRKTADPRDPSSPAVVQLETAMGSALTCFPGARAIEVDRSRFAPVKRTSDLLAVRSDAYLETEDHRLVLQGTAPQIQLDSRYALVDALTEAFPSPPSLRLCDRLEVTGPVQVSPNTRFSGWIELHNATSTAKTLPSGHYRDCRIDL